MPKACQDKNCANLENLSEVIDVPIHDLGSTAPPRTITTEWRGNLTNDVLQEMLAEKQIASTQNTGRINYGTSTKQDVSFSDPVPSPNKLNTISRISAPSPNPNSNGFARPQIQYGVKRQEFEPVWEVTKISRQDAKEKSRTMWDTLKFWK